MRRRYIIKSYSTFGEHDTSVTYYTSPIRRNVDVGEWHRWIGYALLFDDMFKADKVVEKLKVEKNQLCFEVILICTLYASDDTNDMIVSNMPV